MIEITSEQQFNEITSFGTVLVDFYGDNCRPCKMLEPRLTAAESSTDVPFVKVKLQTLPTLFDRYDVMATPTMIVFVDGQPVQRMVGYMNEDTILAFLSSATK